MGLLAFLTWWDVAPAWRLATWQHRPGETGAVLRATDYAKALDTDSVSARRES